MTVENTQEQRYRVIVNDKIINEDFPSLREAIKWAETIDQSIQDSSLRIETYLKPKLLLD